jgi:predicted metal-dependent phosphoesterase TrpH
MDNKMEYLFETHAHTAEASPCALVYAADVITEYKNSGYSGIVITDHVGYWGFSSTNGTEKQKVDNFIRAYENARNVGEKVGLKVFFGAEIALSPPYRDYLVYGVEPEFFYKNKEIYHLSLNELYETVHNENALIFAAHPFRGQSGPPNPDLLDGAEVFNGNPRHESRNDKALKWAEKNDLIKLAGSDFHEHGDVSAGIAFKTLPNDISEFVQMIKSGEYELKY